MFSESTKEKIKKSKRIKILLVLITIILIVLMFPKGESIESEVTVGTVWTQDDLIASIPFEILKNPETYKKELQTAAEKTFPVFVAYNNISKKYLDSLNVYGKKLTKIIDDDLSTQSLKNFNPTFLSDSAYEKFKNIRK